MVDSQVVLVTTDSNLISAVQQEIDLQIKKLPRKTIAEKSNFEFRFISFCDKETALEFVNEYAPEHFNYGFKR